MKELLEIGYNRLYVLGVCVGMEINTAKQTLFEKGYSAGANLKENDRCIYIERHPQLKSWGINNITFSKSGSGCVRRIGVNGEKSVTPQESLLLYNKLRDALCNSTLECETIDKVKESEGCISKSSIFFNDILRIELSNHDGAKTFDGFDKNFHLAWMRIRGRFYNDTEDNYDYAYFRTLFELNRTDKQTHTSHKLTSNIVWKLLTFILLLVSSTVVYWHFSSPVVNNTKTILEKSIGQYVYIDYAHVLHTKQGCRAVYKDHSMQLVNPVRPEDLTEGHLGRVCSQCVTPEQIEELRRIVSRNQY